MKKYSFDVVIIGGGPAGLVAAKVCHGLGKKVALLESYKIGGECTWTGCVPSKALIHASELIDKTNNAYKLKFIEEIYKKINTDNVMAYVKSKIDEIYERETEDDLRKMGITVINGYASFYDKNTILIENQLIKGKKIIISTGSLPFIPPIEGIESINYLTNQTIFNLKVLPKSMLILGGGAIGVEMASALIKLGLEITIVEMNERILSQADNDITEILTNIFLKEGIKIKTNHKAIKCSKNNNEINLTCISKEGAQKDFKAESLLVAVGRKPAIENLNLDKVGITHTKKGIIVKPNLKTSLSHVYACGDIVGPYLFSHMAEYQATIAGFNASIPFFKKHIDYSLVPWVIFSKPEIAVTGLDEFQSRISYGDSIKIYKYPYKKIDRAVVDNSEEGLVKIILNRKGKIIGTQIIGNRAGELIHEFQVGKYLNMRLSDFQKIIHAYPTYSDIIWKLGKEAYINKIKQNFVIKLVKPIIDFFKKFKER